MKAIDGQQGKFICSSGRIEPFSVRISTRARHARVTCNASDGLVVVLPKGSRTDPAGLLERFRPEVERMLVRMRPQRDAYVQSLQAPLPSTLELSGIGERWTVAYRKTEAAGVVARTSASAGAPAATGTLTLSGNIDDRMLCEKSLRSFVVRRAKEALPELLSITAPELGLSFSRCRVTPAHARWGSCNRSKAIMLSAQLAFLPPELVYHIMCHELAHTVFLDHSARFHALLDGLDPQSRKHARQMQKASIYIPHWMS